MTDITTQAVERLAQRHTLNDDEAATLRALAAERDAAIAEAHATGHERAAWKDRAEKAEAQLAGARDAALLDAAERFPDGRQPWPPKAIRKAIDALRDKPAQAVTVQEAIQDVWGCCEELEDEAFAKLSVVKTEHEKGFWTGQKMTAKRIRRATKMPIAGGGDE